MKRRTKTTRSSRSTKPRQAGQNRGRRQGQGRRGQVQWGHQEEEGMDNELHKLFLDELADIYNAEQQLTKALPKMAKAAQSDELRQAFEEDLHQTEQQISRIEQLVKVWGESLKRRTCKGMQGLIAEGTEMMQEKKGSSALDAALIVSAQKVEHYEIASYGSLCAWAEQMGHQDALELLKETLDEEETTDQQLTQLAESLANPRAEQE